MAATPEAKAKKHVIDILKQHQCYYTMPVTGGYGKSGVPDIIGCHLGRFFAIEVKADTAVTTLQQHNLELVRNAGGFALVFRKTSKGVVTGEADLLIFLTGT